MRSINVLNRSWFISGVCGAIGRKLLEHVASLEPKQVIGFDNNESELFYLYEEYRKNSVVKLYTADLRDQREVESSIAGCEIALHAAAVKHVFLCEEFAFRGDSRKHFGHPKYHRRRPENWRRKAAADVLRQGCQPDQRDGHFEADGGTAGERGQHPSTT